MAAAQRSPSGLTSVDPPGATTRSETPVFFAAGDDQLLGVLTEPTIAPLHVGLIGVAGGLRATSMGRNRMQVRLSRQAAARGFHAFRFDYHGVGDSGGTIAGFSLEEPFGRDLDGAARWLEEQGIDRHVYAGICFGARTVMSLVPSRDGVAGVALVELPIRDKGRHGRELTRHSTGRMLRAAMKPWVLAGLFKKEQRAYYWKFMKAKLRAVWKREESAEATDLTWVSQPALDDLERLVKRRIPVLLIYGEEGESYREVLRARAGRLGELMRAAGSRLEIAALPGQIHSFSDLASQQRVIDRIEDWSAGLFAPAGSTDRKGSEDHP